MSRPAPSGGEFFTEPTDASQRRYEALRAYLCEGQPAEQVASRYGYTIAALLEHRERAAAQPDEAWAVGQPT